MAYKMARSHAAGCTVERDLPNREGTAAGTFER